MCRTGKLGVVGLIACLFLSGCTGSTGEGTGSYQDGATSKESAYVQPQDQLEELGQIDTKITDVLIESGYSLEHASMIQEILNMVGIESIEIESMTGQAEEGLNSVVCYPNDYTDRDRRFYFTTEDGVLFYAGFGDEDLYDSEKGGYLKDYGDVHVPEKEVTLEVYEKLRSLATEEVKNCLNYPNTADFGSLNWGIGRSDDNYQIVGSVTAKNGLGVEEEISFSVWFVSENDSFSVEGIALNGIRVK